LPSPGAQQLSAGKALQNQIKNLREGILNKSRVEELRKIGLKEFQMAPSLPNLSNTCAIGDDKQV
jgi:hypothetical protein